MLNDPLDPTITEFVWIIAAQLAKTVCMSLIVQYFIDHEPSSILVTYPKDDAAKTWMKDKFLPMADATPRIREILARGKKEDGATALNRSYPGGELTACGVNSPCVRSASF